MSTDIYTFASAVLLPVSMIHFIMDYLSDEEITHSETKIGIFQYIHHLFAAMSILSLVVLPFLRPTLSLITLNVVACLVAQIGWLKNNEYCWFWSLVNKMINPNKPNRKWTASAFSLLKKYTRSDEKWAYTNVYKADNKQAIILLLVSHLFVIIRFLRTQT